MMATTEDIEQAEVIVSEYGKLLSVIEPSLYGIPVSQLPYDKEIIKSAIQTLLLNIDRNNEGIHDGLTQAYVYIAQFIPDEQVEIAERGRAILESEKLNNKNIEFTDEASMATNSENLELANQAVQTLNRIKTEMENLMNEIRLLIP
jgi:hypothetical protein